MDQFEPTAESLATHAVPDWYHDAKLGIFIHWGAYSVPAYADPEGEHAYAEWYPYYMYREGSDTYEYHRDIYGADVEYLEFLEQWQADKWDPDEWAVLFSRVGARYVVLTAEHHDGIPLWPTHYSPYHAGNTGPERDIVGDLASAVREQGMRFAGSFHANLNYYQPGYEGPFGHPAYQGTNSFDDTHPEREYVDFMNAKHRELIRRYEPDLLWFDTPQADAEHVRANELIADYYNQAADWGKEVVVNDRAATDHSGLAGHKQDDPDRVGGDFATPEYSQFDEITPFKWEACRGIGNSFGYNAEEGPEHHLTALELIRYFVDIVAKNGNLLINVGPKPDGTIPELQRRPLEGLGDWLDDNGAAIFGTRPWVIAEDGEDSVRYTWKDGTLYAIVLEPADTPLELDIGEHVSVSDVETVTAVSSGEELGYAISGRTLEIDLETDSEDPVAIAIDGMSNPTL